MTLTATTNGEYPTGLHWTAGEARDLPDGAEVGAPGWLVAPVAALPPEPLVEAPPAPEIAPE